MKRVAPTSLTATVLVLFALLAGCGQKGALYLPDKKPAPVSAPATTPPPEPSPATPATPKKSDSDKDGDSQPPQ